MLNIMRTQRESPNDFLLDSGASSHMSPNQDWFHKLYQISPREISLGDNSKVTAEAAGDIILKLPYKNGAILKLLISDVLHVPDLSLNLLSCSKLAERGVSSIFDKNICFLIDKLYNDDLLAKAYKKDSLYWLTNVTPELQPKELI